MGLGQVLCVFEVSLKRVSIKVLNDYSLTETITDFLITLVLLNRRMAALNLSFLYNKKKNVNNAIYASVF